MNSKIWNKSDNFIDVVNAFTLTFMSEINPFFITEFFGKLCTKYVEIILNIGGDLFNNFYKFFVAIACKIFFFNWNSGNLFGVHKIFSLNQFNDTGLNDVARAVLVALKQNAVDAPHLRT